MKIRYLTIIGLLAAAAAIAQVQVVGTLPQRTVRRLAIPYAFVNQVVAGARGSMSTNDAALLPSTNEYQIVRAVLVRNATNWQAEFTYEAR